MLIKKLIYAKEARTENLKFRTDLQNLLSMQVSTWLSSIAFHVTLISLQVLIVTYSESCQRLFTSYCALPSEVAVLFNWNLSRHPFLG